MKVYQGWINLYKPKHISSFQAINKIKKKYLLKKIGHAGTLDPLAEGILPVAIGKTTKLIPFINSDLKAYKFEITWGQQTSTDDSQGEILFETKNIPNQKKIEKEIKKFLGYIKQKPPKVSAVKINGQRAYKLVRQKKIFNTQEKDVFVKTLVITNHKIFKTTFEIECGKGFYIRSLARDLAINLDSYGHVSYLERTKVGKFNVKSSILLDDLLKIGQRQLEINCIKSSISMLDDILAYEIVDPKDLDNLSFGRPIKVDENKLKNFQSMFSDKKLIFLSYKGDIVSFGKLVGNLFKPKKILIQEM